MSHDPALLTRPGALDAVAPLRFAARGEVFVQPGDVFVGRGPQRVSTLLGSCVAVTLWHPPSQVGAMCHFLLPYRLEGRSGAPDGRYGSDAVEMMAGALARRGVRLRECEAKVFGGGCMFGRSTASASIDIGRRNGQAALALLAGRGLPVIAQDLFCRGHRQVVFDLSDGSVWSRRVPLSDDRR